MNCSTCHQHDTSFTVRERATEKVLHLCVSCLVWLCLTGALMHPNPRYEYVYAESTGGLGKLAKE